MVIKRLFYIVLIILFSISTSFGADYTAYVKVGEAGNIVGAWDNSECTEVTPCNTLTEINQIIDGFYTTYGSSGNTLTVYLDNDDTWTLTSNTGINIDASNITIDGSSWGSGTRAIIDGDWLYPNSQSSYVINVGGGTALETVSNITIQGIRIQGIHNDTTMGAERGGGIFFSGTQSFGDTALVTGCEFADIGQGAINIYRVANSGGSSTAIKIEHNLIEEARLCEGNGDCANAVQAINTNDGVSYGHEARYNEIQQSYGEGIGASGFAVTEYNIVSGCKNPAIYFEPYTNSVATTTVIRYNLVWGDKDAQFTGGEIRVDDESNTGTNTGKTIEIYGNVVVGGYSGADIRNLNANSHFGSVKVYNNTFIDNQYNIILSYPQEFDDIDIRNNISVINSDAASVCVHDADWSETTYPVSTIIGPNLWYGDGYTSEANLKADWRDGTNVFGAANPFSKTSGWRSLTTAPSLADFTPISGSEAIDNANTDDLGASYDDYIVSGEWTDLPGTESLTTATQDSRGADWDFGAIIYNLFISGASPTGPGIGIDTDLNWTNPTGTVTVDVYFEEVSGACDLQVGDLVVDDGDVATYDPGTMSEATGYCWRVDVNHAGGTETGVVYEFTTTTGPPPPPTGLSTCSYHSLGMTGSYSPNGATVGE